MKRILPFQPQALMMLKFSNFAQHVATIEKPAETFSILAFYTIICEQIESYVNKIENAVFTPTLPDKHI